MGVRQFYDLIEIFRIGGFAPDTNYLFLGEIAVISTSKTRLHYAKYDSTKCCAQATMWIEVYSAWKPYPYLLA